LSSCTLGIAETGAPAPCPETPNPAAPGALAVWDAQAAAVGLGAPVVKRRRTRPVGGLRSPPTAPEGYRERLRERLLSPSQGALRDYELLEMLLLFAHPKGDTKPLAKALINLFGSFANVITAPQNVLLATRGLGPHGVSALKLVQEAALRMTKAELLEQPVLNRMDRVMAYLTAAMAREKIEQFRVLFLDSKSRLLADEVQSRGTVDHTTVYPREVVKRALELHATALILVHNHPSGDPTPSQPDVDMTRKVNKAAELLSIALYDHIIIGNGRATSLRANGWLSHRPV